MVSRSNSPRLIALLAWLVAASAPLGAQTPAPITPLRLSFADAVRLASGEVPVVALATLRTDEADARVRQARAALLPSVSVGGAWLNRSFNSRSIGISFPGVPELIGPFNNYDARLNAVQTLFDWSSVARVRAAGAQADGSRAERGVTVEGSVLTTALAYVRAVRTQSVVAARQADSVIATELVGLAEAQRAAGAIGPRRHAAGERADSRRLSARGAARRAGRRGARVAGARGRPASPDRRRSGCRSARPGLGRSAAGGGPRAAAARRE